MLGMLTVAEAKAGRIAECLFPGKRESCNARGLQGCMEWFCRGLVWSDLILEEQELVFCL